MRLPANVPGRLATAAALTSMIVFLGMAGCGSGGTVWQMFGTPYGSSSGTTSSSSISSTGQTSGSQLGQSDRTHVDPCTETQARKFVTISMRNMTDDYIHYFFVAIAFVDVDQTDADAPAPFFDNTAFLDGAVCEDDVALYTQFGYSEIGADEYTSFGDYCVGGPALIYFHRNGQFRRSAGSDNTGLGSAIAPAQGSNPT